MIRIAKVPDAEAVAEIQVSGWHQAYKNLMPAEHLAAFKAFVDITMDIEARNQ